MKFNVGNADQIVRVVIGLVLISVVQAGDIGLWGWVGIVPLLTGIFSFCPVYAFFGINTKHDNPRE